MDAFVQSFLLDRSAMGVTAATIAWHTTALRKFRLFLEAQGLSQFPNDWTRDTLRGFIVWLREQEQPEKGVPISGTSVRTYCNSIWVFFHWLHAEGLIDDDIASKVKKPKLPVVRKQPYSDDDLNGLFNAVKGRQNSLRDTAILYLLLDTGLRASEVCNLTVGDVIIHHDASLVIVRQGKGQKDRVNPLSPKAVLAITRYLNRVRPNALANSEPLFLSKRKKKMGVSGVLTMIKRAADRSGVDDAYTHRFRHTFAVFYLRNGGDPLTLQRILGHTTLEMTNKYIEMVTDDLSRVHAMASPLTNLDRRKH
ncbi:MAG: tyrosine-type recombinase/integrase [Thermomicrobiales bacterium]|nr:tyrosine-type recombinase/integrase [Thermomicrobiales bacterium]MCO5219125.1 tyrosine-type recombinase/integrase [Thermomicrobiales bacterium]MCO5228751.1 tyrosine-type recombinase/integrase [Thermomicrobiales bacterium]